MRITVALVLSLSCLAANASLSIRAGGKAYYDDVLGITWLADANLAQTSGYDADGRMNWVGALGWIASLNTATYLGVHDWRLPKVVDKDAPGCSGGPTLFSGGDCAYNVDLATGEMAHLFYSTLGNSGAYNTSGAAQPCLSFPPPNCLTNDGPFSNFLETPAQRATNAGYWAGTEDASNTTKAWRFEPNSGNQNSQAKSTMIYAWAVRAGDIGEVPFLDADGDGVPDPSDNCTLVANTFQLDADADGYGNFCDADLNNSGQVTAADFAILRSVLNQSAGSSSTAAKADLNGSGTVTAADYAILRSSINTAPGPSGLHL